MGQARTSGVTLFALIFALFVAGCATPSGPQFSPLSPTPDQGIVYIYRPAQLAGSGNAVRVAIDGQFVAGVANSGYVARSLQPGTHIVSVSPYSNTWLITPSGTPLNVSVESGRSQYVRVTPRVMPLSAWEVTFELVPEPVAMQEIRGLRLSE